MAQPLELTGIQVSGLYRIGNERIWGTESVDVIDLDISGIQGDRHYGQLRVMQPYESAHLARRTIINDKQISIVGASDMGAIAHVFDLPCDEIEGRTGLAIADFMAKQLAANILVSGGQVNEAASHGTLFAFGTEVEDPTSVIRITEYNEPCKKPLIKLLDSLGKIGIRLDGDFDELKERFKEAASDRRGWVASVYQVGSIAVGDSVFTHQPVALPQSKRF